jgi:asparagine synthase (glutamine-hydrolysing)
MCGVCGFTFPAPQAESRSRDLEAMLASMSHRGPDGQGTFVSCGVALGHRRLAIIDLRSGDQPMTGPSGCSIVFNGEIYNYRELRTELESGGRAFATTSDTEVLLAAYEEWDHAFLDRMIGMFAFAIHDPRRGKIVLGRDRLGKKPLYFATTPVGLAFASEIKALLALPQVRADLDINLRAVRDYLALGYILAPKTIYANITRLSPGCLAFYDLPGKRIEIRRYYHPEAAYQAPKLAFNMQTVECFDALLADAVRLRLRSDVPVGVFLSGGLDSSAVTACLGRADADVRLFTARFSQNSFDESPHAEAVARHLGMQVTCVDQPLPDTSELSRIVWHFDEPFCDTSMIPTYNISRSAAGQVKVILGGDGADELLAGYVTYRADKLKCLTDLAPKAALGLVARLFRRFVAPSYKKVSWDYKASRFLAGASYSPERAHYFWRTIFDDNEVADILTTESMESLGGYHPFSSFRRAYEMLPGQSALSRHLFTDMQTWLPDDILVKCDRMSMAHSLELRVPFLDHRLVELVARLPDKAKMSGLNQKVVLKRAMAERLPRAILARAKKGFNFPAYCISSQSLEPPAGPGIFRKGFRLSPQREDVTYKSFNLLILGIWYEMYERFRVTNRWEPLS